MAIELIYSDESFGGGVFGELRVVREIAEEFFAWGAAGYCQDEIAAADETAFPGLADARLLHDRRASEQS
jgi:hypothetical protein